MVYVVEKIIKGGAYLYLQRSLYDRRTKKRTTECVKYLGARDKVTKKQIDEAMDDAVKEEKKALKRGRKKK